MSVKWGTKIAAIFTAAALVLGGVSWLPSAQAAEAQATMTAEEIAKEKELTDAVWEAANWLSIDFEPQQLKDLAVALQDLSKWLYDTGTITDSVAVRGCIFRAEYVLDDGSAGDGSSETETAYTSAMVALNNADTAMRKVQEDMHEAEEAAKAGTAERNLIAPGTPGEFIESPVKPNGTVQCSMDNFQKSVTYTAFSDVLSSDWFFNSVKTAVEYGLVKGTSGTTYTPQGNVTVQEAVVMAARLRCVYEWGNSSVQSPDTTPVGNADTWANAEINFAIQSGIIKSTDFADYKANITRAEMAYIFAHTLPESTNIYAAINTIEDNTIPDVKTTDKYGAEIYTLYRAGVLTGGDGNAFSPDKAISRAETAAIVSRLPVPSEHKNVTIKPQEPVAQNNIPSEYMPVYVDLLLTEPQYQVGQGMTFKLYSKDETEYPLVSKSEYFQRGQWYVSSLVFAAPLNSEKEPVKFKAEGAGLTGRYATRASSWDLGKISDEFEMYIPLEDELADDYSTGLSSNEPISIAFSISVDQAPIATVIIMDASSGKGIGNLTVKVTDGLGGNTMSMCTNNDGKLFLKKSPTGHWVVNVEGTGYTFTNGLIAKDVAVDGSNTELVVPMYLEKVSGAGN